jgi:eukaryotic-like serine/threonine-protein kinase
MPAPTTVDEFIDLVRKSAVLEDGRLSSYAQSLRSDAAAPRDLSALAGRFVQDGLLTYFQAEQFLQGKWKRFSIGKYKVLEKLGSGGMGQVFLCEHKLMRRRVAVKVLPTAKAADPSSLDRFYREARAVAALDHPNIVRAYDIDQDDNLHFLVMEYVDGASLQEMIRKSGAMDPIRACHYMYWSAVGLQHAHQAGLIHRDIKPGNILVDRQGVVKILDLGLARFFHDENDEITKKYDESVLGTADYLAPEQAVDSHGVDGRADIYSLGATFYFLLTGQPPFAEGTVAQKLLWHQSKSPKPVREVRPEVPEAVAKVVSKMMAKKPDDRYQSPGELAEALLPFTQTPIPPPPESEMPQLSAAAQGPPSGPTSVSNSPRTGPPAPRTPAPTSAVVPTPSANSVAKAPTTTSPRPPAPAPTPAAATRRGNAVAVADADTQKRASAPAPVVEPIPDSAPGAPIWEAINAETADANRGDTDRRKRGASSRRLKPEPKPASARVAAPGKAAARRPVPLTLILTVGGGVVLIGGVILLYFLVFHKSSKSAPTPPSGEPRRLVVSRNWSGDPLQYSSVQKAVSEFRPGDTIVLQDDVEEFVAVSKAKGLTIVAAEGKKVVWRAPPGKNQHALLSIATCEGARIAGITFEGNPKVDYAVRLGGPCPGLILEDCDLHDGGLGSLALHDCTGDSNRLVTVRRCRIAGAAGKGAVLFLADPPKKRDFPADGSQAVFIHNCLVEGPPDGAGFFFDGSAAAEIRHCRMWKGQAGVQFHKATMRSKTDLAWQVTVGGCTFHSQKTAGVWIEDVTEIKTGAWNRIALTQNFFAGMPAAIKIDGDAGGVRVLAFSDNVLRKGTPPGQAANFEIPPMPEADADVVVDPNDPTRHLSTPRGSPLLKAANGKPAGVPPE